MAEYTPMMRQYLDIKNQYKDHILFFRLGDFYEMFFDDAKEASSVLELTLTGRDAGQEERVPMCGVPYHSCQGYIARLVNKGYKVAICEQVENPADAVGIVKRDVVRVITPGTVTEPDMLDENRNNYICMAIQNRKLAVCFADISTGEMNVTCLENDDMPSSFINELSRFSPKEIIASDNVIEDSQIKGYINANLTALLQIADKSVLDGIDPEKFLEQFYNKPIKDMNMGEDEAVAAASLLIYLQKTSKTDLSYFTDINVYNGDKYMKLDLTARKNLEVTANTKSNDKKFSLLWVLDKTKTAGGARMLRSWLEQPILNVVQINKRLDGVESLFNQTVTRMDIADALKKVYDMERLLTRLFYKTANARDLNSLSQTIRSLEPIRELLTKMEPKGNILTEILTRLDPLEDVAELIDSSIADEPPFTVREGGLIKNGFNEELDGQRSLMNDGKGYVTQIEAREKQATGIKTLKVGYNRVFGYYIEVSRRESDSVPDGYIRKQTLANCERYITEELKELEGKILGASERATSLEYEIFCTIRDKVTDHSRRITATARAASKLDVLVSLADAAVENNYCKPQINTSDAIIIKNGRHPVVERCINGGLFVTNDVNLNIGDDRVAVITGPNMAGKSTFMRQVALITLMAQCGSFVPAASAEIGIVDNIYTRIGASDDLSMGQSTFMTEMSEVSHILSNATKKSLIIFDEIGRGTSTFDGMSLARAVLEYVADKKMLGAKCLFATHYHELTELESTCDGVKNYNVAVKKRGDDITFLRKIVRGGSDDSYGIEVAILANLPQEVIKRAKVILKSIEEKGIVPAKITRVAEDDSQISLDDNRSSEIIERIKQMDISTLTPIEAMTALYEMQKLLGL